MSENYNQTAETSQSILGAIRQTERNMNRRLAAARDAAEVDIVKAKEQARQNVLQAVEDGRIEGENARQEGMKEIELEAAAIIAQAEKEAEILRSLGQEALESVVVQAVALITNDKA